MSLDLFLESCRSQSTKEQYAYLIQKWFDFAGNPQGKEIQEQKDLSLEITESIMQKLRKKGLKI